MASIDWEQPQAPAVLLEDGRSADNEYDLGQPAKTVYQALESSSRRMQVLDQARKLAELTIPSAMPPQSWHAGDELPGNNQSVGGQCVSTLASKLMFTAFPPGQPMMRLDVDETKLKDDIAQDPELYARTQLALSRLEVVHRKKAATIGLAAAWVGYLEQLIICGNALWAHVQLNTPKFHKMDRYVVSRDGDGHPITTVLHERVRLVTLPKDVRWQIMREDDQKRYAKVPEWERGADIYTVCRLIRDDEGTDPLEDCQWECWQETEKGTLIEGTEFTTDYEDCPMWPGWLIPCYGEDWGLSYCDKYQGDLYLVEAGHSGLNDGLAIATWLLPFVKPGARTSIKSVREAKNLTVLSGSAEDVSVFRSDRAADLNWASAHIERAERRLGIAFLSQAAARREGERVTADEVQRVGQELDQAMGGLYTGAAQGPQRRMLMRFVKLHEDKNKNLPRLPAGLVDIQVVSGVDALGRTIETQALLEFIKTVSEAFPQKAQDLLNTQDFITRLAAGMGINPTGLVASAQEVAQRQQAQQQQAMQHTMVDKGAGPVAKAVAEHAMPQLMPPQGGQQQPQGAPDGGAG